VILRSDAPPSGSFIFSKPAPQAPYFYHIWVVAISIFGW
jgi:hypothetical protein